MADTNLDILIRVATEGGPQAGAVIKQLNELAADGSKSAADALRQLGIAQVEQTKNLQETAAAQNTFKRHLPVGVWHLRHKSCACAKCHICSIDFC